MSKIPTIAERLVTYYNDLIKNNVISGESSVTLEWMKRQRILEGRSELDIRFGHITVDSVLGEKTPLAKAEQYLNEVRENNKYELLPKIARLLSEECITMLPPNNSIRRIYESLNEEINIQIIEFNRYYDIVPMHIPKQTVYISISVLNLEMLTKDLSSKATNLFECSSNYLCECTYYTLVSIFIKIKQAVEALTK